MGVSGSKPDWYPGEPTDNANAPPGAGPHATAGATTTAAARLLLAECASPTIPSKMHTAVEAGAGARATASGGGGGGGGLQKETGERERQPRFRGRAHLRAGRRTATTLCDKYIQSIIHQYHQILWRAQQRIVACFGVVSKKNGPISPLLPLSPILPLVCRTHLHACIWCTCL